MTSCKCCLIPITDMKIIIFSIFSYLWWGDSVEIFIFRIDNSFLLGICRQEIDINDGIVLQDYSKGVRLEELNVLLKQTVMVVSHTHINHLMSTSTFHIFFLDIINYFSRSILQFWHQLFKWLAWHFEAMRAVLLWNLCSQIGLFDECILIVFSFYLANPT